MPSAKFLAQFVPAPLVPIVRRAYNATVLLRHRSDSGRAKAAHEMNFWRRVHGREGILSHDHFEPLYTTFLQLDPEFYVGKRVLDIGCGPRGSLEWANAAAERVGLDPLVEQYRELGIENHAMTYVNGSSDSIPFPDGYFDVVTSLNSLDHVDDLDATLGEITRVLKVDGTFGLIVEVGHEPTITEPISLWFDLPRAMPGALSLNFRGAL